MNRSERMELAEKGLAAHGKTRDQFKNADVENSQRRDFKVGDKVEVHGEVGTIIRVKKEGQLYEVRFHYGTVEVQESDIEGIASHVPEVENAPKTRRERATQPK